MNNDRRMAMTYCSSMRKREGEREEEDKINKKETFFFVMRRGIEDINVLIFLSFLLDIKFKHFLCESSS